MHAQSIKIYNYANQRIHVHIQTYGENPELLQKIADLIAEETTKTVDRLRVTQTDASIAHNHRVGD